MSKPPRIPESGNAPGPVVLDSTTFLNSLSPILEFSDDSSLAGEAGKRDYGQSADQAASKIDSLISTLEITATWALDGGLKLPGLAEAAARIGIHLDNTFLDSVAANAGSWHSAVGLGNGGITWPAPASDRVADTTTTLTGATVASSSLLAASTTAIDLTVETRVAAAGDDVEQKASGSIASNVTDLELAVDGTTSQTVGLRFTGIDIPKGAIITSAYIQFQANEVKTGATSLLVKGEDADDSSPFTTVSFNVSSRATTDASTAWAPDPWTTVGTHGVAERTPDLSAIVQEIVNRSGWAALNDMAFLITGTGTRTADSYEYNPAGAPLLHIEYQLPSPPVAFNTPPDADPVANQIAELAASGAPIGITASAADPDAGSTVTYSLNDARFAIDASSGVITRSANGTLDFETQPSINLTVTATSSDGSTANQNFTLAVLNNPEPVGFNTPPDADTAVDRIAQNAAAGTAIGITASAKDSDAGSTVTYSIDDARFAINASTGIITRSGTGTLNAVSEPSVNLTVTATSSDGSTDTHAFSVGVTGAAPVIVETRVAAAGDDVEQKSSGSISTNVTDLEMVVDGTTGQTVGVRFIGIDIPQGAIITSAYIQFQANEVKTGATSLLIKGEDADDASPFTSVSFNVSSRATTDASTAWAPDPWTTVGAHGLAQRTPDLSAVVQEIVNRSGWAALNDMAFMITGTGTRTADSYEYSPAGAPLLHIEYLLPGPVSPPVAFNTPPDADTTVNQIAELAAAGAPTGITASATDPDAGSTVTYSLNDSRFAIDASSGVITRSATGTLDFETQPSINLTVTASSSDGSLANKSFTLAVLDNPEPVAFNTPPDTNIAVNRIAQNDAAGTAIGITASAKDPDIGSTVTYSLDDARFAINPSTGVITRSGTGTLNAASEPSINLHVTATSSDGSTATQDYTVGVVPTAGPQTIYRFAIFGDFGDTDLSGEKAVSAMIHAWNVDFVLTVGDNAYAPQTFDPAIGQQYHDYIGNYQGAYGSGSTINRFFPTLGNHEYNEGTVPAYQNYFTLPDNERYYDFQIGPVHFFALNSNKQDPDGRSSTSVQGQWAQSLLANSDASFNVAYFHHTPYNPSGGTGTMQWPFEQWGVNAVFAGHQHNYYRENRDDNGDSVFLPYTTTGLGGAGRSVPNVGANLVTVTDAGMLIEFYKVSSFNGTTATSVLTDSYFVPTPAGRTPTIVDGGYVLNGTIGADYLWGLGGNATLIGGRGNDMLIAGNQNNLFVFAVGDGQDTIANFVAGAGSGDVLDLRAFGITNASQFQQVATDQGANVVASLSGGDQITLLGVHEEQFHNDNFLGNLLLA
ncbi:metallophosphoesterase [Mesorhizobium sp. LjNodule214]|uniref:metallophosphoesterase n=1 Tax=Mesorhizobium sp. LjNodule214 TaxID=3342252 RepID=UPI003ECDD2C8